MINEYSQITNHFAVSLVNILYSDDGAIDDEDIAVLEKEFYNIELGGEGYVYAVASNGDVIIHPIYEDLNVADFWYIQEMFEEKEGNIEYKKGIEPDANRSKLVHYDYVPELDWIVASGPFLDVFDMCVYVVIGVIIGIMLISLLLSFIISLYLTKKIYIPIEEKHKNINKILYKVESEKKSEMHNLNGTLDDIKNATKKHSS